MRCPITGLKHPGTKLKGGVVSVFSEKGLKLRFEKPPRKKSRAKKEATTKKPA